MGHLIDFLEYISLNAPHLAGEILSLAKTWGSVRGIEIPELKKISESPKARIDAQIDKEIKG